VRKSVNKIYFLNRWIIWEAVGLEIEFCPELVKKNFPRTILGSIIKTSTIVALYIGQLTYVVYLFPQKVVHL
jgi:hypothetical protein